MTATATSPVEIKTTATVELMGPDTLATIGRTEADRSVCTTYSDGQISFREVTYTDWYFEFTHPRFGDMIVIANTKDEAHDKIHEMLTAQTKEAALVIANRYSRR